MYLEGVSCNGPIDSLIRESHQFIRVRIITGFSRTNSRISQILLDFFNHIERYSSWAFVLKAPFATIFET